jgi:cellulose synthase/poly-beta-1,6-N-acetylglucosamine synthase-like glycosyltransferase
MEVIVRLHRHFRERREKFRIVFRADPVCWTEVPESRAVLARQRNRWQRGTMQTLGHHHEMLLNPRYGVVGMVAVPYYLIFEALAPAIELAGLCVAAAALALGWFDWTFAELYFLVAVAYGAFISVVAVILEEVSFRRYPRVTDLLRLTLYGLLENFGYRQLTLWWRLRGSIDYLRGRADWGAMARQGFASKAPATPASAPPEGAPIGRG